ncbi:hypothetical protein L1987_45474 [Smallanthus sonchifolius]|uniref:Uncharacterized protein n=1 Tax=Smallanthus sonchifolius TaxID=185202 RepID=A0ACB9FXQ4_9ASTR|nr:hypothetical protein L1987_45474 [Smallanthus sonchifolius]
MNREKSIGGKHTLGSQTFVSAKLKAAKIVENEFPFRQMWRLSHFDERSHETWKTYEGYLEEKYGNDASKHPEFDSDLWSRAVGGKNKGKIYGLSNVGDPLGLAVLHIYTRYKI